MVKTRFSKRLCLVAAVGLLNVYGGTAMAAATPSTSAPAVNSLVAPSSGVSADEGSAASDALIHGQPLVYWVKRLWRVIVATPASRNPEVQLGENCVLTPTDSPVSFVYGFQAAPSERTCHVPKGKTVVFPVWGLLNDYPCPDPSFQPTGQQTLETFLRLGARQFDDATKNLVVNVDGQRVDYTQHRLTTPFFSFKGDASLQQSFDSCITGSWQTAVADGWYLVYPSWQTGQQHTISVTAIAPSGAHDSLIYHLVIDP